MNQDQPEPTFDESIKQVMKTLPPVGRPPEFNPVPGDIWIAVSSTPSWKAAQRFKLTTTEDIPLDGSSEYAVENVGESQWFWAEVPLAAVKAEPKLKDMALVKYGRLSVQPVTAEEWKIVGKMAGLK